MCVPLWAAIATTLAVAGCDLAPDTGSPAAAPARSTATADDFLRRHWHRPLLPQGVAPSRFSPLETSLAPAACGSCHPRQFDDWRTALHSKAMSPGLFGQLQNMGPQAADEHQACLECHAPLAEQARQLVDTLAAAPRPPPRADGVSHADGLTCAGCHVRDHKRFGPPRRDGSQPAAGARLAHDGWQIESAFTDSRFCAACHQFEADGPSLNSKPLENTYEEWRTSRHAREGRTCQACHMPQRRHLWRGIHDPKMVRSGLTIEAAVHAVARGKVVAELVVANTGVGHAFPTYVTPRVMIEIGQEDRHGNLIAATVERHVIRRDVSLDLTTERADTRIMPDERRRYAYDRRRDPRAAAVILRITVQPDAFYADFYRATLRNPEFKRGRSAIAAALRRAETSPYELFRAERGL